MLQVEGARHPVLDELLGDQYVPNDVTLGSGQETDASLALITGPNMAGKSTYIRTAALIALLAHTGSFVPADAATVGLCDRLFTRVGAHDELHAGRSTFMVEMTETANICHHATDRSLVILDEIGRGTSTLDGLSLAWAITEHLAAVGCRCLFATHYHELTQLADAEPAVATSGGVGGITNLNVTVREWNDQIVFLHRIVPGATDRSYGIQVAKLAGLPDAVVTRAHQLLGELAVSHEGRLPSPPPPAEDATQPPAHEQTKPAAAPASMPLFAQAAEHPVVEQLRQVDLTQTTPMDAFDLLRKLQQDARDDPRMTEPLIQTGLQDGPVAAVDLPIQPGCGGECVFLGRTRTETHPEFGGLLKLSYEAYAPMAARQLDRLARQIAEAHGCHAVRLVHATGRVPVGHASVVIQTLTPHRAAAFAACREAIDRLKREVPIWKREVWERGETFVEGQAVESGK